MMGITQKGDRNESLLFRMELRQRAWRRKERRRMKLISWKKSDKKSDPTCISFLPFLVTIIFGFILNWATFNNPSTAPTTCLPSLSDVHSLFPCCPINIFFYMLTTVDRKHKTAKFCLSPPHSSPSTINI